jgi:hypothetical protein
MSLNSRVVIGSALLFVGCATKDSIATDPLTAAEQTTFADTSAIYRAVLSSARGDNGREPLVVGAETEDAAHITDFEQTMAVVIPRLTASSPSRAIPDGLLDAFRRVYAARLPLDPNRLGIPEVTLLTAAEYDAFFRSDENLIDRWHAFFNRFGTGMTKVSAVAFSADGAAALLTISHECGSLCGSGEYVMLRKANGAWQVVAKQGAWVS